VVGLLGQGIYQLQLNAAPIIGHARSGGFEPESEYQIVVYVDYARDSTLDRDEVLRFLKDWMNDEASAIP